MIKLIIFDFDGVIIQGSNEGYFRCYHKALEDVGIHLDPKEERRRILSKWGTGHKIQLANLLRENSSLLPKAIKAYKHYYNTDLFSRDIRLIRGVRKSLENLSRLYTLAIASGMMRKTMDQLMKSYGIHECFKKIVTNEGIKDHKDRKPSPFMLNNIIQELSMFRKETVFVGDAANDVEMARNAGVIPIVVLTGHLTRDETVRLGVKHVITDINSLKEVLHTL